MRAGILARWLGIVASLLVVGCGSGSDLQSLPGLQDRLTAYYSLEQRGDWRAAYEFRNSAFRKTVPKDRYVSQMQKDNQGWRLINYAVVSSSERDGKVYLKVKFTETPPAELMKSRFPSAPEGMGMEIEDESIWIREDGNWYAYAPGKRSHLSLNVALVP